MDQQCFEKEMRKLTAEHSIAPYESDGRIFFQRAGSEPPLCMVILLDKKSNVASLDSPATMDFPGEPGIHEVDGLKLNVLHFPAQFVLPAVTSETYDAIVDGAKALAEAT